MRSGSYQNLVIQKKSLHNTRTAGIRSERCIVTIFALAFSWRYRCYGWIARSPVETENGINDRPGGRPTGRLFSGLANWFSAARLDYANRTCVLAFDRSAHIPTQHTHARGLCVYHCTVLTHTIAETRIRRHVRLTLRTRIPMSPGYMCAGILDREHLLMLPRPPANQAFSNARNGISEVFSVVIAFLAKPSRSRLSAHFSHISSHTYLLFSSREKNWRYWVIYKIFNFNFGTCVRESNLWILHLYLM